ncbi:hypothetical protein LLH00_13920 [bacterium]|nr:hypothetical protein [bacterium]
MNLDSINLALQVQTTLERRALDNQASSVMQLISSVTEQEPAPAGGRDDRLGKVVDLRA